ncbi:MAG TPA: tripartite tricarboxylate transporter TctB family protein [Reyranella sp.]|nr:tripartite tricarboxylate transporter TctB family protein [Reyranella sp.]
MSRLLSKDFLSGVMFIAFGLGALWFGRHLQMGTTVRMGPGYVPHMLAYIMLGLGLIIAVVALYSGGEQVEAPKWRPITMVTVGIIVFALLFETTGMFPSLVALVLIASLGGDEFKLTEVIGNIIVLTILCILVFKVGLQMNISVINGVW